MNIKKAKEEIKYAIQAYLAKDEFGEYRIPAVRQRPVLLMGAPGIGKTAVMEQVARECGVALVSYSITHHTRQSAIGLPFISKKEYGGKEYTVTELSHRFMIKWRKPACRREFCLLMKSTVPPKRLRLLCSNFCSARPLGRIRCRRGG